MCNLSDGIERRGINKGLEQGLVALVTLLKPLYPNFESMYQAIISTDAYANVDKALVMKYYSI